MRHEYVSAQTSSTYQPDPGIERLVHRFDRFLLSMSALAATTVAGSSVYEFYQNPSFSEGVECLVGIALASGIAIYSGLITLARATDRSSELKITPTHVELRQTIPIVNKTYVQTIPRENVRAVEVHNNGWTSLSGGHEVRVYGRGKETLALPHQKDAFKVKESLDYKLGLV